MLLILAVGLAELICLVTLKTFKKRFTFFDLNNYMPTKSYISNVHQRYHPERGWDDNYSTKFGERPRTYVYNDPFISAFGDSYTHCAGVKDNETWEEYLSVLLKKDVYNFGTRSYGTDQAYLKFRSIFPKVRTPIVILGLITENINRIVNVYRPFYFAGTAINLSKPRFILKDRLYLLPNPIRSFDEINNLRNAHFLRIIGQNDYWFNRDRYPELRFPYTKILFNKIFWLQIIYSRGSNKISDIKPRPYINLWEDIEATALMFKILESFVTSAKDYGAIPLIMILPCQQKVVEKFKHEGSSLGEKKILDFCRKNNISVFNSIEVLARHANSVDEIDSFFNNHVSAKGNQIIAQHLYNFLNDSLLSTNGN